MTFLHPWAIAAGAAALALPLAIHWLTRPRPIRLPLSTVRFVREAVQQRRARHRLRDALILGLRVLAVALFALAIARPQSGDQPIVTPEQTGSAARVVVLDVSQSMAAESNGVQQFERARPLAAGYLGEQSGLLANLILAGAAARPAFEQLSMNSGALREELAKSKPLPERLNVQAALQHAADLFARLPSDGGLRRELVVVSDFQRSNWAAADFSVLPEDTRIQLDSVSPAQAMPNLAILRVSSPDRAEQGRDVRLEIEVGNYSPAPRRVEVEVALGESVYRLEGLCPPGTRTVLGTEIPLRGNGWQSGEARLLNVQDSLPADNVRPFVLEVRPAPTFALLTAQSSEMVPSSSYYLERALNPLAARPGRPETRVVRVDPAHLDRDALAAADVFVIDRPGRLAGPAVNLLATLLRRGRGILYVAATPVDAVNLKLLSEAAGSDLQLPVEFVAPPARSRRRDLFLVDVRREQAPFRIFGDNLTSTMAHLRFSGGLASRRREGALADDIVATYSDRSACLVVCTCGDGSLAVLNADLVSSNLPSSPAFVPLIGELAGQLLGRNRSTEATACGEPLAVYLPASAGPAAGLRVVGPNGKAGETSQLIEENSGVLWQSTGLQATGIYHVKRGDAAAFSLSAALPPEEADLQALEASVLAERLAGGRKVHYRAVRGGGEERDNLWVWLAGACVLCGLGEVIALKIFRT